MKSRKRNKKEVKFTFVRKFDNKVAMPGVYIKSGLDISPAYESLDRALKENGMFEPITFYAGDLDSRVKSIKLDENFYLSISGRHTNGTGNKCEPVISFAYINGDVLAEWEVQNGPITIITKCLESLKKDTDFGRTVKPHHIFGWCTGYGNWAQMAVNEFRLPESFIAGKYSEIRNVLEMFLNQHLAGETISISKLFMDHLMENLKDEKELWTRLKKL